MPFSAAARKINRKSICSSGNEQLAGSSELLSGHCNVTKWRLIESADKLKLITFNVFALFHLLRKNNIAGKPPIKKNTDG